MYHAIIVDDEQMIINRLVLGFDWNSNGYEVIATCTDSVTALDMIRFIRPDVVFTDIKMPGLSGIELMRQVRETLPQIQFVFISGHADFQYAHDALQMGACGYCLKPLEDDDIESALSAVSHRLEERQSVIQSAFDMLMLHPLPVNAERLLRFLYPAEPVPGSLMTVLSLGDASSLLSGNVCYSSIRIDEKCHLYLISANAEYLTTGMFHTALLRAVSGKQITSISWKHTDSPAASLAGDLLKLFDAVYSCFVFQPAALGPLEEKETAANAEFLDNISTLANKGRAKDICDVLTKLLKSDISLLPSEAVSLYNICTSFIMRLENAEWKPDEIHYPYELARKYKDIGEMLQDLQQKFLKITGQANPESVTNESLRRILEYINHNFTKDISFQEIADEYTINSSYLSQLFKKELGVTFTGYLTNLRIQYAKELLATTTMRINEIPEKIGYRYDYNFAKLFKKETGLTPKEYRKQKTL